MKCLHINIRKAAFIVLSVLLNGVQHSHMAGNHMDLVSKDKTEKNATLTYDHQATPPIDTVLSCPTNKQCNELPVSCFNCTLNTSCKYGHMLNATCKTKPGVTCKGSTTFEKMYMCRYCYQTELWEHKCELKADCNSAATPRAIYHTNCTISDDVLCLGNRRFLKNVRCNWTGGYRWSTALALSITLGGFGADRFYLGHWQEGIGKLFSFGGLGVWTIIDVILISLHYLGPADGSLYI